MANEPETATKYLLAVARPIAVQFVEFGDKLAVGTGAALVVIVSQLDELKDFIHPLSLFASAVLSIASLLSYMVARYCAIKATVIADAEPKFDEIRSSLLGQQTFDMDAYFRHVIETSVWPASWLIRLARRRNISSDVSTIVIRQSQKVTRYVTLQVFAMFAALLVLIGSYTFDAARTDAGSSPTCSVDSLDSVINYFRIGCPR